jgi:hypothetical protein
MHHEMWRDELHCWLVARDSAMPWDVVHNRAYDGQPPLWYLLLWILERITHDPIAMQVVHVAIAASVVWVFASRAPFRAADSSALSVRLLPRLRVRRSEPVLRAGAPFRPSPLCPSSAPIRASRCHRGADYRYVFSSGRRAADVLRATRLDELPIVAEFDYPATAVIGQLGRYALACSPRTGRTFSFVKWTRGTDSGIPPTNKPWTLPRG